MKLANHPRRSVLYVPAHKPAYLAKTAVLKADAFLFDLGESVPVHLKEMARQQLKEFLSASPPPRRELWVRINSLDSPWGMEDLRLLASAPLHGIVFTRIESAEDVSRAAAALDTAGGGALMLAAMIESPRAVLRVADLAAHPQLDLLILETTALKTQLRLYPSSDRAGLLLSLSQTVLAGRAFGKGVIDGSHMNLKDTAGFEFTCRQGRDLGFDGRTLSHPDQIVYANEAYRPKASDMERARRIIDALNAAHAQGEALAILDDRLLQPYEIDKARRLIRLEESIRRMELLDAQSLGGAQ